MNPRHDGAERHTDKPLANAPDKAVILSDVNMLEAVPGPICPEVTERRSACVALLPEVQPRAPTFIPCEREYVASGRRTRALPEDPDLLGDARRPVPVVIIEMHDVLALCQLAGDVPFLADGLMPAVVRVADQRMRRKVTAGVRVIDDD